MCWMFCSSAELAGETLDIAVVRQAIEQQFASLGADGFRTLGLAYKYVRSDSITNSDETQMTFLALLVFLRSAEGRCYSGHS
jgi:Mg2+-importing ATPase